MNHPVRHTTLAPTCRIGSADCRFRPAVLCLQALRRNFDNHPVGRTTLAQTCRIGNADCRFRPAAVLTAQHVLCHVLTWPCPQNFFDNRPVRQTTLVQTCRIGSTGFRFRPAAVLTAQKLRQSSCLADDFGTDLPYWELGLLFSAGCLSYCATRVVSCRVVSHSDRNSTIILFGRRLWHRLAALGTWIAVFGDVAVPFLLPHLLAYLLAYGTAVFCLYVLLREEMGWARVGEGWGCVESCIWMLCLVSSSLPRSVCLVLFRAPVPRMQGNLTNPTPYPRPRTVMLKIIVHSFRPRNRRPVVPP